MSACIMLAYLKTNYYNSCTICICLIVNIITNRCNNIVKKTCKSLIQNMFKIKHATKWHMN